MVSFLAQALLAQALLAQAKNPATAPIVQLVGDNRALQLFGVKLVGVNVENATKLLLSVVLIAVAVLFSKLSRRFVRRSVSAGHARAGFWARQGISVFISIIVLIGLISIWFDDPTRLSTALGLMTAGLAFALQRVVTALAGYVLILRGSTFNVGDRIVMGGVRGDVIALGFMQTTIMEMGQPPPVQNADPAMWVRSRQYTGRIVTVSNAKVFDEPVFNYTRDFDYIWEEMVVGIGFRDETARAEQILLDAARRHTVDLATMAATDLERLERIHHMPRSSLEPRVFWRLTDNWVEMSLRFLVPSHGVREIKDAMSRDILAGLNAAKIDIASATFEIVGLPPLKIQRT